MQYRANNQQTKTAATTKERNTEILRPNITDANTTKTSQLTRDALFDHFTPQHLCGAQLGFQVHAVTRHFLQIKTKFKKFKTIPVMSETIGATQYWAVQ